MRWDASSSEQRKLSCAHSPSMLVLVLVLVLKLWKIDSICPFVSG